MYTVGGEEMEELGVLMGCSGQADADIGRLFEGRGHVLFVVKCSPSGDCYEV